ncbi:DNA gyrase subunit A [archaeon]|jgi:DNA gyrase subunit A|nr:DNA gyrase subunit A [archaeon]MBT4396728.1 DNA gyrase subunit A [archaeon]MBT4441338.1 DNA gyrase subunit A [archaeon]
MEDKTYDKLIEEQMKEAYLDYSMSVIVGRALPDVKDGLKPVHRRVLYAMQQIGLTYNKSLKKCARIVGEVLGKYHPHGDTAVYDSLVRMAQDFSLRYPLVKGQGNFGSVDGDNAAAMRYTEAKMTKIADELLFDIGKETVDFTENFDGSLKEPIVLPAKLPNLLINGSTGIAVGMATNIPPHNLKEVCTAILHLIDNPDCEIIDLMEFVTGPDFPTGGLICGRSGIRSAYLNGRGRVVIRAKSNIEEKKGRESIIITEIPYMVNKSNMLQIMADLVRDKRVDGISDIRDESDRTGMRVVIKLKKGFDPQIVLNLLYKHTQLQNTFGVIMLALVDNQPRVLNLKQILEYYREHRKDVIVKRTKFDLKKAEDREHILLGLMIALEDIDKIVQGIKKSNNVNEAREFLINNYSLSEKQSQAILDMKLQKLTSLETQKIKDELEELKKLIAELKSILDSDERILGIIRDEVQELIDKFGDERRSEIIDVEEDIDIEDLIAEEDMVITRTASGYVKRISVDEYKTQRRGGKGVIGATTKEEDIMQDMFIANTHDYLLCFSNLGQVFWLKAYQIPESGRYSKGKNIVNLLNLRDGERISGVVRVKEFDDKHYLIMVTKNGLVKKTSLKAYSRPRKGGIIGVKLREGDELVQVRMTPGWLKFVIASRKGRAVRFDEKDVRESGRNSMGVRGIRLGKDDEVVGMEVSLSDGALLTITRRGYGKRTKFEEYRLINRGGKGVLNIRITEKNGEVVAIKTVKEDDELMLVSQNGVIIRVPITGIALIGRATQGVRIMRLNSGDRVTTVARIDNDTKEIPEEEEVSEETKEEIKDNSEEDTKEVTEDPVPDTEQ